MIYRPEKLRGRKNVGSSSNASQTVAACRKPRCEPLQHVANLANLCSMLQTRCKPLQHVEPHCEPCCITLRNFTMGSSKYWRCLMDDDQESCGILRPSAREVRHDAAVCGMMQPSAKPEAFPQPFLNQMQSQENHF